MRKCSENDPFVSLVGLSLTIIEETCLSFTYLCFLSPFPPPSPAPPLPSPCATPSHHFVLLLLPFLHWSLWMKALIIAVLPEAWGLRTHLLFFLLLATGLSHAGWGRCHSHRRGHMASAMASHNDLSCFFAPRGENTSTHRTSSSLQASCSRFFFEKTLTFTSL